MIIHSHLWFRVNIFHIRQWSLVKHHALFFNGLIVEVKTFPTVRPNASTSSPLPRLICKFAYLGRRPRMSTCLLCRMSIASNIQHLLPSCHPKLTHTTIPRHISSIPMLKRSLLGLRRKSRTIHIIVGIIRRERWLLV